MRRSQTTKTLRWASSLAKRHRACYELLDPLAAERALSRR